MGWTHILGVFHIPAQKGKRKDNAGHRHSGPGQGTSARYEITNYNGRCVSPPGNPAKGNDSAGILIVPAMPIASIGTLFLLVPVSGKTWFLGS